MDIADLQHRVALLPGLLTSQRETIERLLFQLAFSEQPHFVIAANTGVGKSTLLMALAELFSAQCNVAMLRADVSESEVNGQLMQQWFALPLIAEQSLTEQVSAAAASSSPLLLLVDDAERFSTEKMQELASLPGLCICFSRPDSTLAGTYLTLPVLSLQDAAQLLQHESLNSIELSERHARANGNIHLLLLPLPQPTAAANKPHSLFTSFYLLGAGCIALLSAVIGYGIWQSQPKDVAQVPASTNAEVDPAASNVPAMALPKQALSATTSETMAAVTETAAHAVDRTSHELTAGSNTERSPALADVQSASLSVKAINEARDSSNPTEALDTEALAIASDNARAIVNPALAAPDVQHNASEPSEPATLSTGTEVQAQPVSAFLYEEIELLNLDKKQFALQLTVLTNDNAVQRFSGSYESLSLKRYQRNWQGQMQIIVLIAPFTSAAEAKSQVAKLPAALKNAGPFVKTLQAVQAEIRARELSQNSGAAQ